MTVRVRIAPSPTGSLHVGNVRTFLFNWLFARHHDGVFILRVEDTDPARNTEEAYHAALYDLRWIGLDWDEGPETGGAFGPYRQSERQDTYKKRAMQLLEMGAAYRCYCTKRELDERRALAMAEKRKPIYDERCYRLTEQERRQNEADGKPSAIRFHVPETGELTFTDLVIGEVTTAYSQIEDFVILRSDESPLYQLAVVVDDVDMKVTHVIRGDDHLSNTPKQILLHRAFGNEVPQFAHVPQVAGHDGKPLSKRHGAVSIAEFREGGYLSQALMNYLALLGWGTAEQTIFTSDELIQQFRVEDVHASPARFDFAKLDWLNGEYIRALDPEELARLLVPWFAAEGLVQDPPTEAEQLRLRAVVPIINTRITTLAVAAPLAESLFRDVAPPAGLLEELKKPQVDLLLRDSIEALEGLESWTSAEVERVLREIQTRMELKPKTAFTPVRIAVSGAKISPPLFESMEIIGRDESLRRLRRALTVAGGAPSDEL